MLAAVLATLALGHVDTYFLNWAKPQWTDTSIERLGTIKKSVDALYADTGSNAYYAMSNTRGVLYTAGPEQYNDLIISVMAIRQHSNITIEAWLDKSLDSTLELAILDSLDVTVKRFANDMIQAPLHTNVGNRKFQMKAKALLYTQLDHILALDADCIPTLSPDVILDTYGKQSVFWPDLWETSPENPAWSALCPDCTKNVTLEVESGQMILYKPSAWVALEIAAVLLQNNDVYTFLNGDKDTYRLAMLMTDTPFHLATHSPHVAASGADGAFCGHSLLHFLDTKELAFVHHSGYKLSRHRYIPGRFAVTKPTVGYMVLHDKPQNGIDCINYESIAETNQVLLHWETQVFEDGRVHNFLQTATIVAAPANLLVNNDTLITVVDTEDDLDTLSSVARKADIDDSLADPTNQITVFAPVDSAFDKLKPGVLNGLLADAQSLSEVMKYHVYPFGALNLQELDIGTFTYEMANNDKLVLNKSGPGDVRLETANGTLLGRVIKSDILAINGVAHLIDTVLIPPQIVIEPLFLKNNDENFLAPIFTGSAFSTAIAVAILVGNEFSALFKPLSGHTMMSHVRSARQSSLVM